MNCSPSSFATELAARLKLKNPEALKIIDNTLEWEKYQQSRRTQEANKLIPGFCENVHVFGNRHRNEYFELQLLPPEDWAPYWVRFKRYAVPGRYWIYGFDYRHEGSGRVVYGSEGGDSMAKALKMLEVDLDKPQVVELFAKAFSAERIVLRYQHDTLQLLGMVGPKSKAYRMTGKLCEKVMEERKKRFEKKEQDFQK